MPRLRSRRLLFGVIALCALSAGVGARLLWSDATRTADATGTPAIWPAAAGLPPPKARPVLIAFVHPRCPGSQATIGALARVMAHAGGGVKAWVLIQQPAGTSDTWVEDDLWRAADRIPGLALLRDEGGREARYFGAATSGQVVHYDADGRLLYSGGLPRAAGPDAGRRAPLTRLVVDGDSRDAPVGCPLF